MAIRAIAYGHTCNCVWPYVGLRLTIRAIAYDHTCMGTHRGQIFNRHAFAGSLVRQPRLCLFVFAQNVDQPVKTFGRVGVVSAQQHARVDYPDDVRMFASEHWGGVEDIQERTTGTLVCSGEPLRDAVLDPVLVLDFDEVVVRLPCWAVIG